MSSEWADIDNKMENMSLLLLFIGVLLAAIILLCSSVITSLKIHGHPWSQAWLPCVHWRNALCLELCTVDTPTAWNCSL